MSELRELIIDGNSIKVPPELTLIQACGEAGVEIPRFCYHERLSIAGNCRMCLVEIVGGPPKPAASCAMQVRDLRYGPDNAPPEVRTTSPMVKAAREGVMEFLLINHPLDCPICDQGGECDLQDQAMAYGFAESRYVEPKRAMDNLDIGPIVETHMTRCISCTRCVRFMTEVAGVDQMGQIGRGEDTEITSYLNQSLTSNMQGNIIDLCPVGALTSKPYAFTARPWELSRIETIDVMDALGSNIRVDTKGREVMRILPRNHDGVNEEWISDKTRYVWDGLQSQRLDRPYVRENGHSVPTDWAQALKMAGSILKRGRIAAVAGDLAPVEAIYALGMLIKDLGGTVECRTDGSRLPIGNRSAYVGTARISDIDEADEIILIGTNPRDEAPVLNARIRGAWNRGATVWLFGPPVDLTYDYGHLGFDYQSLAEFAERHARPGSPSRLVIVGQGALRNSGGESILALAMRLAGSGLGMLVLHVAASRVGAMDVGFTTEGGLQRALENASVIYNLGSDEADLPAGPFVIYQGSHGDRGAHRADLILPGAAYTEEGGIFVNTEGRPQLAERASFPPGTAKENWAIIRAVSAAAGNPLPFDSLLETRRALVSKHPHLGRIDEVPECEPQPLVCELVDGGAIGLALNDHYLTNPIARASQLMAKLSASAKERESETRAVAE